TERGAVSRAEFVDEVAQRAVAWAAKIAVRNPLVQIIAGQAKLAQVEQGMAGTVVAERVEIGDEMPQFAVGMHQILQIHRRLGIVRLGRGGIESSRQSPGPA